MVTVDFYWVNNEVFLSLISIEIFELLIYARKINDQLSLRTLIPGLLVQLRIPESIIPFGSFKNSMLNWLWLNLEYII